MSKLYYTAPEQKHFDEVKTKAIEIWGKYDDTYGYATEKITKVKGLENIGDNFMYIVAMFDPINQIKLSKALSEETRQEVGMRIKDGGADPLYNYFLDINY